MTKKLAFIIHGKLRDKEKLMREIKIIFNSHPIEFFITERAAHATELTSRAIGAGCFELISVGGDGTLNEVINGVMNFKATATNQVMDEPAVAVYPKGTGNDFAKTVKMPADLQILKQFIEKDEASFIDLGIADFTGKQQQAASRYFINITDVGMGGIIAEKLAGYSKWMGAYLSFQRAIISTLATYKKQPVLIKTKDLEITGEMMNVVVANGKYFGNGLGIAPDASLHNGRFSLITIGNISLLDYLKLLGEVKKCRKVNHREVSYMQAGEVMIDAPGHPLPIDMDGEFIGYSPLKIKILPRVLKFRMPRSIYD